MNKQQLQEKIKEMRQKFGFGWKRRFKVKRIYTHGYKSRPKYYIVEKRNWQKNQGRKTWNKNKR